MLIGFIGAPSCGKTTTALGLAYELKRLEIAAEFVPEAARQKIIECRVAGIAGNGGVEGQKKIYAADQYLHGLYRNHGNAIVVTDGTTVNCFFYGLDGLDLGAEVTQYDLLFYIPLHDTPYKDNDANRIQNRDEIIVLGKRWDASIIPLQQKYPHIITTLYGFPHATPQQMVTNALALVQQRLQHRQAA